MSLMGIRCVYYSVWRRNAAEEILLRVTYELTLPLEVSATS